MLQPFTMADVSSATFYSFWGYMFLTLVKNTFLSDIINDEDYRFTRYVVVFIQNVLLISTIVLILIWWFSEPLIKHGVLLP